MTLKAVVDYLRIPRPTVYKLVRKARIPGQTLGTGGSTATPWTLG